MIKRFSVILSLFCVLFLSGCTSDQIKKSDYPVIVRDLSNIGR